MNVPGPPITRCSWKDRGRVAASRPGRRAMAGRVVVAELPLALGAFGPAAAQEA
jgi:hypothetical protein